MLLGGSVGDGGVSGDKHLFIYFIYIIYYIFIYLNILHFHFYFLFVGWWGDSVNKKCNSYYFGKERLKL